MTTKSFLDDTIKLIDAIGAGARGRVRSIIQRHQRNNLRGDCRFFIEASDAFGQTPLTKASQMGDLDTVKFLVEHAGASVNGTATTSIHFKTKSGLVKSGCSSGGGAFRSPLVSAVTANRLQVAEYLLQHGAWVHSTHMYQMTCLHISCDRGSADMVRILLKHGADANAQDQRGWTPLYQAAQRGHLACVQQLVQWKNKNIATDKENHNRRPSRIKQDENNDASSFSSSFPVGTLVWVCRKGEPLPSQGEVAFAPGQAVDFCPGQYDWVGVRLTDDSVGLGKNNGHVDGVHYFDADERCGVFVRMSALTVRQTLAYSVDRERARTDNSNKENRLLDSDCNVNLASFHRQRGPLHVACQFGRLAVVQYLLEHTSVGWRARDTAGATPLHMACAEGHLGIVQTLVERCYKHKEDDDPRMTTQKENSEISVDDDTNLLRETPLWAACVAGAYPVAEYLIQQCGARVNVKNAKGHTLLFRACSPYRPELIDFLIHHGANVHQTSTCITHMGVGVNGTCIRSSVVDDITPLGWAVVHRHSDLAMHLVEQHKANVEAGGLGRTPLWRACHVGNMAAVEWLVIHHDARVDDAESVDPNMGLTPLGIAAYQKRRNIVRFLLQHTATPLAVRVLFSSDTETASSSPPLAPVPTTTKTKEDTIELND